MRTLRRFFRRLRSSATTQQDEERLRAEIDDHLALQTAENIRAGLSPLEARRQAVLKFGGVEATKESYRDQRGLPFLETVIQDTRHAVRRLRLAPAFTIPTILTLALGIGATTSIFTLVHAVLLKSLPVANPGELYRLGRETRCCYRGGYSQDKEFSLGHQLYGINPYNPAVALAAILALGSSALVASLVPAFRASLISPLDALRTE
jgi:hypothetical protein